MPDLVNESHYARAADADAADNGRVSGAAYANEKVLAAAVNPGRDSHKHTTMQNGYNLFQQAIIQRVPEAWGQIYQLYTPLVQRWVVCHPGFANTDEDIDYFVNRTFEKIWGALTPEKFGNFPELNALLAYLQMCVNSVIVDHLRAEKRYRLTVELSEEDPLYAFVPTQMQLGNDAQRLHFWECIRKRLKNETEYKLLYYRFVLDIKPRQLCTEFGDIFPNISLVYTLTQNILARLRRDPSLAACRHDLELIGSPERV